MNTFVDTESASGFDAGIELDSIRPSSFRSVPIRNLTYVKAFTMCLCPLMLTDVTGREGTDSCSHIVTKALVDYVFCLFCSVCEAMQVIVISNP